MKFDDLFKKVHSALEACGYRIALSRYDYTGDVDSPAKEKLESLVLHRLSVVTGALEESLETEKWMFSHIRTDSSSNFSREDLVKAIDSAILLALDKSKQPSQPERT